MKIEQTFYIITKGEEYLVKSGQSNAHYLQTHGVPRLFGSYARAKTRADRHGAKVQPVILEND